MTQIVETYFLELNKYVKKGLKSMDWAEWAHEMIYDDFITKMDLKDWLCIKKIYKNKPDTIKGLLAFQISFDDEIVHLSEPLIKTKLEILHDIILTGNVGFEAASRMLDFTGITTFYNYPKEVKKELEEIKMKCIDIYFNEDLIAKIKQIAKESNTWQREEIYYKLNKINP